MVKRHLKRLSMPITWPIKRKGIKFITRQNPGVHKLKMGMSLVLILRDILKYAKNTKEAKYILNNKEILVNGKRRKELKFPVGLFDIIGMPELKEYYLVMINERGVFYSKKIKKEEANLKLCSIVGKTVLKKGKLQLNLSDGRNFLIEKDEFKVGDNLLIDLEKNKIVEHLKFAKNSLVYISQGKYVGKFGILKEFNNKMITVKMKDKEIKTKKEYADIVNEKIAK